MSQAAPLQEILLRPDVWRGDRLSRAEGDCVASGFAPLDAELPGGGWPRGALVELLAEGAGIGELSLLLPCLRQAAGEGPLAIVAPPQSLHAPAWAAALPQARLWVIDARGEDAAWSTELLLASGAAGAVIAWLPGIDARGMRRLQLATEGTHCLSFVFRPLGVARSASPAVLRLALSGRDEHLRNRPAAGLGLRILKRRGPPCAMPVQLAVERPLPWARLPLPELPDVAPARPLRAPVPLRVVS